MDVRSIRDAGNTRLRDVLAVLCLVILIATGCGGTRSPRTATQLPREASGPSDSPAVQSGFAVQGALNMPASQTTMEAYLGSRYAGDWVVNNGKTGILYVGAVHLVNADQKYASSHLRMGSDASVKFVNEKYSMTQLDAFDEVVEKYINSHTKGKNLGQHLFDSFGVSPPDNAVELTLSRQDAKYWIPRIQPLLPYEAFVVQYSSVRAATALAFVLERGHRGN